MTRSPTTPITRSTSTRDAVAFAVLTFAYSTESVNGVVGKSVPGSGPLPAPAGPEGTCPAGPTVACAL